MKDRILFTFSPLLSNNFWILSSRIMNERRYTSKKCAPGEPDICFLDQEINSILCLYSLFMNLQTFKMLALNILCFICYLLFFIWLSLISNLCSNNDSKRSADSFCVTVVWLIRVLHPRLIIK